MAKGPRKQRNPIEKLQDQIAQLDNTARAIIEAADKPGFADAVAAFKKNQESEKAQDSKTNKEAREVAKLLHTYPGLSKQVLSALKSKIAEYKSLGVIEKYKTETEQK
jgi:hypothetical protein